MDDWLKVFGLTFIAGLLSLSVLAQSDFIPSEFQGQNVLNTPVLIDQQEVDSWWVSPENLEVKFLVKDLLETSAQYLDSQTLEELKKKLSAKKVISSKEARALGVEVEFNEETLVTHLNFSTKSRKKNRMNLSPLTDEASSQDFLPPTSSGHLSINMDQDFEGRRSELNSTSRQGNLLFFQNIKGISLETGIDYSNTRENEYARDLTVLTHDQMDRQERYQVGDQTIAITGFQTSPASLSASVTRSLNLRPSTFIRSAQSRQITLKRRSTVEVYVNNILVDRQYLPPGPVTIDNFPFASGYNEVYIKVIDDTGQIEEFNYNTLFNQQLIAKDLSEYHYSINAPSDFIDGKRRYHYEDFYFSSFFQYGLTHQDNIGAALQLSDYHKQLGFLWAKATPIGLIQLEPFVSYKDDHYAHAERLTVQSNDIYKDTILPFNVRLLAEKRSLHFSQLGLQTQTIENLVDFYSNFRATNIIGVGLGFRHNSSFTGQDNDIVRLDLNLNIFKNLTTGINFSKTVSGPQEDIYLWTLNWTPFNSTFQSFSSYDSSQDIFRTQANVNKNTGVHRMGGLVSYTDEKDAQAINSQVIYRNQRISSRIDHRQEEAKTTNDRFHTTRLNFGTGIVWAEDKLAMARPINSSFAIIDTTEDTEEAIPVGSGGDVYQAEINRWGPGVVTNLQPHYRYRYNLDTINIPLGMSFKFEDFSFKTTYRRGALIEIPVEGKLSIQATLLDNKDKPLTLRTGSVFNEDGKLISRFFTNREGDIFIEELSNGEYLIVIDRDDQLNLKSLTYKVSLNQSDYGYLNLETLKPIEE